MRAFTNLLLLLLVIFLGYKAYGVATIDNGSTPVKTAYDRVVETNTLRCAYTAWAPFMQVDPNTKQVSGPIHDIVADAAERLGLKVEWVEDVSYGQVNAGLQAGRYDAFCGVLWATTIRQKTMLFTDPLYLLPVHACVKADSTAYDTNTDALNAPDKTFAVWDSDVSMQLVKILFPQAKMITVSPMASGGEWLENVITGKADAVPGCDKIFAAEYSKTNPGKIKIAAPDKPMTHIRDVLGLNAGEHQLKAMLDQALFEMVADGSMERHLRAGLGAQANEVVFRKFQ
ncbi:MAG: substrate-binding periplasmic protein [Bdellovibrionales bacterium]